MVMYWIGEAEFVQTQWRSRATHCRGSSASRQNSCQSQEQEWFLHDVNLPRLRKWNTIRHTSHSNHGAHHASKAKAQAAPHKESSVSPKTANCLQLRVSTLFWKMLQLPMDLKVLSRYVKPFGHGTATVVETNSATDTFAVMWAVKMLEFCLEHSGHDFCNAIQNQHSSTSKRRERTIIRSSPRRSHHSNGAVEKRSQAVAGISAHNVGSPARPHTIETDHWQCTDEMDCSTRNLAHSSCQEQWTMHSPHSIVQWVVRNVESYWILVNLWLLTSGGGKGIWESLTEAGRQMDIRRVAGRERPHGRTSGQNKWKVLCSREAQDESPSTAGQKKNFEQLSKPQKPKATTLDIRPAPAPLVPPAVPEVHENDKEGTHREGSGRRRLRAQAKAISAQKHWKATSWRKGWRRSHRSEQPRLPTSLSNEDWRAHRSGERGFVSDEHGELTHEATRLVCWKRILGVTILGKRKSWQFLTIPKKWWRDDRRSWTPLREMVVMTTVTRASESWQSSDPDEMWSIEKKTVAWRPDWFLRISCLSLSFSVFFLYLSVSVWCVRECMWCLWCGLWCVSLWLWLWLWSWWVWCGALKNRRVSVQNAPVCTFKNVPVHEHMLKHMYKVVPVHTETFWMDTRRRFSARHTTPHVPHQTHTHTHTHTNTTPNTTSHGTSQGDRQRERARREDERGDKRDDERTEKEEEREEKEKEAFSRAPEVEHVGVTFCSFSCEKRSLEYLLSMHDACWSKPLTIHNGFMFFCFSYLFQEFFQNSSLSWLLKEV